jgi:glutamate dehydrogenase
MAVKPEDAKAARIDEAVAQVRERLPSQQVEQLERFVRAYFADAAPEDLGDLDLYGAALAHWQLLQRRPPGEPKIHVYTPTFEEHGWQ